VQDTGVVTPPPHDSGVPGFDSGVVTPPRDGGVNPPHDGGVTPPRDGGLVNSRDAATPVDVGVIMPGAGQLWATCTGNADCMSTVCFDMGMTYGRRCVQACGSADDCPSGFTCHSNAGARLCLPAQAFTGATFANASGTACMGGGECKSNFCGGNMCIDSCADDADCSGTTCRWYQPEPESYRSTCEGPLGSFGAGAACVEGAQCTSGLCVNDVCTALCSSTADCGSGNVCAFVDSSICTLELLGICLTEVPFATTGCVPSQHGGDAVGAACTGFASCRSGLCHTGIGQCTDMCGKDADCPSTHRCKPVEFGRSTLLQVPIYGNACLPTAF